MSDADNLLRAFVDMADRPAANNYLEQLAQAHAAEERMASLLGRFEQKIQRLEAMHAISPRVIARQMLAITRVTGKTRRPEIGPLDGWKKLDGTGQPVSLESVDWSAVRDQGTRLEWSVNVDGKGDQPNPCRQVSWRDALGLLSDLNYHNWCGRRDWRLPTIGELETLMYTQEKGGVFLISPVLFPDLRRDCVYWSSTRHEDTQLLRTLEFRGGTRLPRRFGEQSYVRFVRSVDDDES